MHNVHPVNSREGMMKAIHERHANPVLSEQIHHPANERGRQERHVATRRVNHIRLASESMQSGRKALKRTVPPFFIPNDMKASRQVGKFLPRRRHDNDLLDRRAKQSDDALQHEFPAERKPCFRPSHSFALSTTKDNAASFHSGTPPNSQKEVKLCRSETEML